MLRENFDINCHKVGDWAFDGENAIWLAVPKGNSWDEGELVRLPISKTEGSNTPPVWKWNGSKEKPTLSPSINVIGIWHGFLRDGILIDA